MAVTEFLSYFFFVMMDKIVGKTTGYYNTNHTKVLLREQTQKVAHISPTQSLLIKKTVLKKSSCWNIIEPFNSFYSVRKIYMTMHLISIFLQFVTNGFGHKDGHTAGFCCSYKLIHTSLQ